MMPCQKFSRFSESDECDNGFTVATMGGIAYNIGKRALIRSSVLVRVCNECGAVEHYDREAQGWLPGTPDPNEGEHETAQRDDVVAAPFVFLIALMCLPGKPRAKGSATPRPPTRPPQGPPPTCKLPGRRKETPMASMNSTIEIKLSDEVKRLVDRLHDDVEKLTALLEEQKKDLTQAMPVMLCVHCGRSVNTGGLCPNCGC